MLKDVPLVTLLFYMLRKERYLLIGKDNDMGFLHDSTQESIDT
jgi:hypothetical protein